MFLGSRIKRSIIAVLTGCLLGGCSLRVGDFTVASTKNIGQLSQKGESVVGEDCSNYFLFFPIAGPSQPNFKTALDRALEKAKGDVVVEAILWETSIPAIIFNQHCFKVEGKIARAELGKK
jgi:hypothetical protein